MHACMHACMHIYIYIYMNICVYMYDNVCISTCIYMCIYIYMCMYVCVYIYIYIYEAHWVVEGAHREERRVPRFLRAVGSGRPKMHPTQLFRPGVWLDTES